MGGKTFLNGDVSRKLTLGRQHEKLPTALGCDPIRSHALTAKNRLDISIAALIASILRL